MNRLKTWWGEEKVKLSKIHGFRKKGAYIWEYYWIWIVGISFVVFFIGFFVYRYTNTVKDYWFYITFANTSAEIGNNSQLWKDFKEYGGYDTSEKSLTFNNTAYFDYAVKETLNTYFESFVAYTDAGTLDAVTMSVDSLILLGQSGRLLDLNTEECSSIKEKYGDRFLYAEPYDEEYSEDLVPVGIDVSDSILMSEYDIYTQDCALGIGAHSNNIDAVEDFLDFILEG